jgi:hypothetical protein
MVPAHEPGYHGASIVLGTDGGFNKGQMSDISVAAAVVVGLASQTTGGVHSDTWCHPFAKGVLALPRLPTWQLEPADATCQVCRHIHQATIVCQIVYKLSKDIPPP